MKTTNFNNGWRFQFYKTLAEIPGNISDTAESVTIPHDFRITLDRTPESEGSDSEAFYPGGFGIYEKDFEITRDATNARMFFEFDGVYRFAEVFVNGHPAVLHHGGYTPFTVDISRSVVTGRNRVRVLCNCALLPASRWYTGAGIYREVKLLEGNISCIAPHGVSVIAGPDANGAATVTTSTNVLSNEPKFQIRHRIIAPNGNEVACGPDGVISVENPMLWSAETPTLYTLKTELLLDDVSVDQTTTKFGIRSVSVDSKHGLRINGKTIKMKGGCCHHDNGIVGAISTIELERRRVAIMKDCGFNAIRCSHNPPSSALLDACDSLGMYVIDEAFDSWFEGKRTFDEHIFFEAEWEHEIESIYLRDRNHPSVIIWSTGNEIPGRDVSPEGAETSDRLATKFRLLDATRPVTNALCEIWDWDKLHLFGGPDSSITDLKRASFSAFAPQFSSSLDIVGYNYLFEYYEKDSENFPNKTFCGTETFPLLAKKSWDATMSNDAVIGDFVWTAWDYLGESGIGHSCFSEKDLYPGRMGFPWHLANCGDIDITGRKRPQSYYRDFIWTDRTKPFMAVRNPEHGTQKEHVSLWGWPDISESWSFSGYEGKSTIVTIYSAGDKVVLFLNGVKIAEKITNGIETNFEVKYYPGRLLVESYRNGRLLGTSELVTSGKPFRINSSLEKYSTESMAFVDIEIRDNDENVVTNSTNEITVTCRNAKLLGLGAHDPQSMHNYSKPTANAVCGRLFAVFRPLSDDAFAIFTSQGLESGRIILR